MNGLIFDIGANNGDNSAYYLRRGFRVVAVEANTAMVEVLRNRFSNELRSGLFELLPCGIAAEGGQFDFWVCDDNPDWSSFDRSTASRNGARHHKQSVKTRTFASIVRESEVPHIIAKSTLKETTGCVYKICSRVRCPPTFQSKCHTVTETLICEC